MARTDELAGGLPASTGHGLQCGVHVLACLVGLIQNAVHHERHALAAAVGHLGREIVKQRLHNTCTPICRMQHAKKRAHCTRTCVCCLVLVRHITMEGS